MIGMIHDIYPDALSSWAHHDTLSALEKSRLGAGSPWLEYGKLCTFALEEDGRLIGRVTAMINPRLQDQEVPTGLLGFFAFSDEGFARHDAGLMRLAEHARAWLAARGMQRVRGPMNFNTWYTYRADSWVGDYPRFPGEDMLDTRYSEFLSRFMQPLGTYASQLLDDYEKAHEIARSLGVDRAGAVAGVEVVALSREEVLGDIRPFFDLASLIFPQDFSYGPIGFEEFKELYVPVLARVPDFTCQIAREKGGRPVGLAYGYAHPFASVKTSIVKTIGVLPEYRRGLSRGISWFLMYQYHVQALERGYRAWVHATMKEDNTSRAMSGRFARKIREYTLFEGKLG